MNTPTQEQFNCYQSAYDYFNESLFAGKLKPCLLNFRGKSRKNMGLFWPNKWTRSDGSKTHEISLNPEVLLRPLKDTFSTLVHEMCHQQQQEFGKPPTKNYHDRQWGKMMEDVGLIPSNTGEPGGKKTGAQMTHYIAENGPFDKAFKQMPQDISLPWLTGIVPDKNEEPVVREKKSKYVCPCDKKVSGEPDLQILCVECGEQFMELEGANAVEFAKVDKNSLR
jgi:predicted SprT family Zn-dependent metalloprotease